ncbi:MAG: prolipoprotein diacylglyceryl transferase [Bacilli bacterium]|nr:prolipoprotein diacylglyceryl transferase [Bacilli bacterium]
MAPRLFGFIDSYSLMLFLGVALAVAVFEIYFRIHLRENRRIFYLELCVGIALILGIAGAYLMQNLYNFVENPASFTWSWSLTFYGGALFGAGGFLLTYFLYSRKKYPGSIWLVLRIFPACICGAHALGRIGCFLEGCCYGKPTDAWYGVQFATTATKVIPTNLFEAMFLFVLFGLFLFLAFRYDSDFSVSTYMMAYGAFRFAIEFFRDDHRGAWIPGLTPSQFWSILLFVGGVGLLIFFLIRRKRALTYGSEE